MSEPLHDSLLGSSAETISEGDAQVTPDDILDVGPGTRVGRYVVSRRVGAGGMGVVLSASDPQLGRTVAIKLLHRYGDRSGVRIRREAQALARLNHPNVVAVHDVGEFRDHLFVAMEYVDGVTLRAWLRKDTRGPSQILSTFIQAGRGLAAAHQAGLVHRDFKPDNVMVSPPASGRPSDPDRVRIMDFGLAEETHGVATGVERDDTGVLGLGESGGDGLGFATRAGRFVGTPRYMAPEQFGQGEVGPAADQFSFCVALYERLWGQLPFRGDTAAERAAAAALGDLSSRRAPGGVSRRVARAIYRGLEADPDRRWASMQSLLHELEPRRLPAGVFSVLAVGVAASAALAWPLQEEDRCGRVDERLDGRWDEQTQASIHQAFVETGSVYGEQSWDKTKRELDAWTSEWTEAVEANCVGLRETGATTRELDLEAVCLGRQLGHLDAVVEFLSGADRRTASRAVDAVSSLAAPTSCKGGKLASDATPTRDDARYNSCSATLSRCSVLEAAGQLIHFDSCTETGLKEATELGDPHLVRRARRLTALAHMRSGRHSEAISVFEAVYFDANAAADDEIAKAAAHSLAFLHARSEKNTGEADRWINYASSHRRTDAEEATHTRIESVISMSNGRLELAIDKAHESVRAAQRSTDARKLGFSLSALGHALRSAGRYDDAAAAFERTLEVRIERTGEFHPFVATTLNNLGSQYLQLGRVEEALALYERSLEIRRALLVHPHFHVASAARNVGDALHEIGQYDRALGFHREAALVFALSRGPRHLSYAKALRSIGEDMMALGQLDDAQHYFVSAVEISAEAIGSDDPRHVSMRRALAGYREARGEVESAIGIYDDMIAQLTGVVPDTHPVWTDLHTEFVALLSRGGRCTRVEKLVPKLDVEGLRERQPRIWAQTLASIARCHIVSDDQESARAILDTLRSATDLPDFVLTEIEHTFGELQSSFNAPSGTPSAETR